MPFGPFQKFEKEQKTTIILKVYSRVQKKGLLKRGLFRKVHFLEILEKLEILEILENPRLWKIKENPTIS